MRRNTMQVLQVSSDLKDRPQHKAPMYQRSDQVVQVILHNTQRGGQGREPNRDDEVRDKRLNQDTIFVIPAVWKPLCSL
ncbi:hypothetical protein CLCR_11107 [Cladophialophora carrionii]|uniref:Uncharacterized protein n=1 Tax=Cladophialophora carrionii TaxID=86049 RepID=A0A1C1CXU8_9EURO|nr:hypothetical protein CLCR_11107 [Cladophialophora carrionii]